MQHKATEKISKKIQVLRGLSIIAVVFIHNTPTGITQVWCRPFLNFAVGMFLFLSGLLSSANKWDPLKRIKKVIIPYVIWTAIYVLLNNYKEPSKLPITFIRSLLTGNSAAIMYFIFVYCELTLLIPLIDKLAKSKYKFFGFAISPFEIIIMRLIPLLTGTQFHGYISLLMSLSCLGWFVYFYLGYLLGNNYLPSPRTQTKKFALGLSGAIILQIIEGYWYFSMGNQNCGTQLKLSSLLSGVLFVLLAHVYLYSEKETSSRFLYILGEKSFGIYFSHLALMTFLNYIPYYKQYIIYPFNAILTTCLCLLLVQVGNKTLGKKAKYLAL